MVRERGRRGQHGAGTVLALAMTALLVTVALATVGVVGIVAAHRTAQSAADLAALAGAGALQRGGDACAQAARVAGRNATDLRSCQVEGWVVSVVVVANTARLPGGVLDLEARGRAGPALSPPGP